MWGSGKKDTLQIFIDTNVLLSFYAFSNDDLEQLRKLIGLMKKGDLTLYFTSQVRDEFYRNREIKLAESIRQFEKGPTQQGFPRFMEAYPQTSEYEKAVKAVQKARNELVKLAKKEADEKKLTADILVADLMGASKLFPGDEKMVAAAYSRMMLGNPPGKPGNLGDRLNWEILLANVAKGQDLHIISKDGDFQSPLGVRPHQFLSDEWRAKKNTDLFLHNELTSLFQAHFPQIKFAIDIEKQPLIENLILSGNFASTHAAIEKLTPFVEVLTKEDVEKLATAAVSNSQITWIASDEDVYNFYRAILPPHFHTLDSHIQATLDHLFHIVTPPPPPVPNDDLPF
jgi:predicted nucleic acid-binding protein